MSAPVDDMLLPPNEDAVRATVARLGNTPTARRVWAAYDTWIFVDEQERQWLHDTVRRCLP